MLWPCSLCLAHSLWDVGFKSASLTEMSTACRQSELNDFGFSDDFYEHLWTIVLDVKQQRLPKVNESDEPSTMF